MNKIVSDLGRDHDFIPLVWKCFRDQFFAETSAVGISRIEQSDAEIECLVHERDCFPFGKISPPAGGNCPQTKTDFAHGQVCVLVSAKTHGRLPTLEGNRPTLNFQTTAA